MLSSDFIQEAAPCVGPRFRFPRFPYAGRRARSDRPRAGRLEPGAGPQAARHPGGVAALDGPWPGSVHARPTGGLDDFGGFPPELYTLQYAAPGSPELAARAQALLADAGIAADRDPRRPLDHGAWCRCATCIPRSTPVVQLSLDMERDAAGQSLNWAALRAARRGRADHRLGFADAQSARCAHAAGCAAGVVCAGVPAMVCRPSGRP